MSEQKYKSLGKGKWLELVEVPRDGTKPYELVRRTTQKPVDGVMVVVYDDDWYYCIVNQRPLWMSLEWPAGLVDDDEKAEETGVREVREETGFEVKPKSTSGVLGVAPWMNNEKKQVVVGKVKSQGKQQLQGEEKIRVVRFSKENFLDEVETFVEGYNLNKNESDSGYLRIQDAVYMFGLGAKLKSEEKYVKPVCPARRSQIEDLRALLALYQRVNNGESTHEEVEDGLPQEQEQEEEEQKKQ